jgi:hypothetical protein
VKIREEIAVDATEADATAIEIASQKARDKSKRKVRPKKARNLVSKSKEDVGEMDAAEIKSQRKSSKHSL